MSDKKTQILEATERLLAKHGFDRLSMQMVAKEAGVAAGTIYRYFSDKNDLLIQLRAHVVEHCAEKMMVGYSEEQSLREQFNIFWRNAWELTISRDDNAINREQFDSLPYENTHEQKMSEREAFAPIHHFFQHGIANGEFKPLGTDVLSSIGIEPAICLARKQVRGVINLDASALEAVINACWDAISLHTESELSK
ncbi:TetR/AcrR family transcriptional regulator [Enterovibrio coralii]|uniref:TetR family transcriptional regulator n=1 Tax=Enterovibrio coralii TaxID=294935 RepID=A0A135IB11_9GAMM|nr:TetR/AcrR family transcriptional regulator [Enterovibrio coralii]KXF82656.1 TetR family transcriptional regulator [Enterovibrio coralii]